ncbi:hypothetical protein AAL_08015 [Moelleriella libera RCEF 2490]|uniref:Uncharacterized protein n=1 Tax=Moelleriella libera RCEF 2490 TaxID=1081109 RepID=A0A167WGB7_9HYPO|nr:hypothetical protein AAL_08015 [Moelleriella libera RCEF 2490]
MNTPTERETCSDESHHLFNSLKSVIFSPGDAENSDSGEFAVSGAEAMSIPIKRESSSDEFHHFFDGLQPADFGSEDDADDGSAKKDAFEGSFAGRAANESETEESEDDDDFNQCPNRGTRSIIAATDESNFPQALPALEPHASPCAATVCPAGASHAILENGRGLLPPRLLGRGSTSNEASTRRTRSRILKVDRSKRPQTRAASVESKFYEFYHLGQSKEAPDGRLMFEVFWKPTWVYLDDLEGRQALLKAKTLTVGKYGLERWNRESDRRERQEHD